MELPKLTPEEMRRRKEIDDAAKAPAALLASLEAALERAEERVKNLSCGGYDDWQEANLDVAALKRTLRIVRSNEANI